MRAGYYYTIHSFIRNKVPVLYSLVSNCLGSSALLDSIILYNIEVRLLVTVLSPCPVVSDTPFPKEAFSIGEEEEQERENTVEGPPEMEDVDECQVYQSTLCHHRCINTPGSFRCACYPGYVLQQDAASCLPGKIKLLVGY